MTVVKQPGQLGRLGHVRLDEERRLLGVEAQRQHGDDHVEGVAAELLGVADAGQRVVVGDEVVGVVLALEVDELPERAEVVADVQGTRRLDSRQNAHGPSDSRIEAISPVDTPAMRGHRRSALAIPDTLTVPS